MSQSLPNQPTKKELYVLNYFCLNDNFTSVLFAVYMGVSFHSSDSDWGAWRQVQETMNNNFTYPIQHNDLMKACGIHLTKTFSTYHSDKYQFLFSHFLGFSPLRITFPNLCVKPITILLSTAS